MTCPRGFGPGSMTRPPRCCGRPTATWPCVGDGATTCSASAAHHSATAPTRYILGKLQFARMGAPPESWLDVTGSELADERWRGSDSRWSPPSSIRWRRALTTMRRTRRFGLARARPRLLPGRGAEDRWSDLVGGSDEPTVRRVRHRHRVRRPLVPGAGARAPVVRGRDAWSAAARTRSPADLDGTRQWNRAHGRDGRGGQPSLRGVGLRCQPGPHRAQPRPGPAGRTRESRVRALLVRRAGR